MFSLISLGCKEATQEERRFTELKLGAEKGVWQDQLNLGLCYENGVGTKKDDQLAVQCYKRGLQLIEIETSKLPKTLEEWKNLASSYEYNFREQYLLGLYFEGRYKKTDIHLLESPKDENKDRKQAKIWYEKSIGTMWSRECLDAFIRLAELSEDEKTEKFFLEEASRRGSAAAKYKLSEYCLYVGVKQKALIERERQLTSDVDRYLEGIGLLEEAVELGGTTAAYNLSVLYYDFYKKSPIGKDEAKAWMYIRTHEEQQLAESKCDLWYYPEGSRISKASMVHYLNEGTEIVIQDRIRALSGDTRSQYALSVYLAHGKGVKKDPKEAIIWCRKSAGLGDTLALLSMGNRFYDGNGVIRDEIEAYACWNLAGCELKEGRDYIAKIEKDMTEAGRLLGQKRTRELQAEIETNKSKVSRK